MDSAESDAIDDCNLNAEEQQRQDEGGESSIRPTLSQVKKSWGFRRSTIAKREFMEEVGDLSHSPPPTRKLRGRKTNPTSRTTTEDENMAGTARTAKSVIDELQWSAPSSPASEDSKPASEASTGANLDPTGWQDFGSAFHTAFSLLGGEEGLSMTMSDALGVSDMDNADAKDATKSEAVEDPEVSDNMDTVEFVEPGRPDSVAGEEIQNVVLISSQEEDSDNMTLMQIKEQLSSRVRQESSKAKGGKGGRGRARGRGRGRARGKGKARGRGRAVAILFSTDDDGDNEEEMVMNSSQQSLELETERIDTGLEMQAPSGDNIGLISTQSSGSDCIIIDNDSDKNTSPGQYDNAPEDEEKEKDTLKESPSISDTRGYDADALCCICRQKHDKRFMVCCGSCQEWFHGDCVGIGATESDGQEYICQFCTTKNQSQVLQESAQLLCPSLGLPECLTLSPPGGEEEDPEDPQDLKESVGMEEVKEIPVTEEEAKPELRGDSEMDTGSSVPLCIGPGCSKQALPDSVYCGPDCILQHAAVTMKTLSVPKEPKSKKRAPRNAQTAKPAAKAQRSGRTSKRLAAKAEAKREEEQAEEEEEEDEEQEAAVSPKACDPILTEVQAPPIPPSKLHTASNLDTESTETDSEVVPPKPCPVEPSTDSDLVSQPATEASLPQSHPQETAAQPVNSDALTQQPAESDPSTPSVSTNTAATPLTRHHGTGALMVTKTAYVIPKKPSGLQSSLDNPSTSASFQRPSAAVAAAAQLSETRNLPVSPAPSAPSSRPSQPNNQIRQSIQRSLTGILFKRVCECEDLEMTESEAAKLVASIEMEMFDIFRNTDSKYMNKYRTIMFNLKDPRNKGLLYRVVLGEIGPFRLVRMSQKDMQATKAPEPIAKKPTEAKGAAAKEVSLQKPEAVKLDLPALNPNKLNRKLENTEQKRNVPPPHPPVLKTKPRQQSQTSAVPDILACMLKDTTSEHKTHLFDLKCKICTGQMIAGEEEEPVKKKSKMSRDKQELSWKKTAGDDSPLRAPPDSPDRNLSGSSQMETSHLLLDSPVLTIIESPASPVMDSPASPTLESPASPVMESPASPTQDTVRAATRKRAYAPVVIPAVSTVTISRRDPRTAANRFPASFGSTSGCSGPSLSQAPPYFLNKETAPQSAAASSRPPVKTLPKSILMKPSSTADPRLYGTSPRTSVSQSLAQDETSKFLMKQDIVWKGFLNMLTVAKFVTKGYLVSGSAENLKADLPDTIQIGGRILPHTVWEYVAKLKTSVTKELCVIRFQPATEEEEVAYVSMFSYFSSRGRFGVVSNSSGSIKDMYLFPLSAKEPIPSILQPLEGPGLEPNRPNLLLGLAIVQRPKRAGSLPQETEEKRPKVHMSKDPAWIPKPPVLYGSDKLEIFQPYDPETPASTTPPLESPSCPGSPPDSSSSSSVTAPSFFTSMTKNPSVSTSVSVTAIQPAASTISDKNATKSSNEKTAFHSILKTLFRSDSSDSTASPNVHATKSASTNKMPVSSEVSRSMMDPIVQQYGQKSKVKNIEEEENDFDRPYDPEEEYDPAMGYGMIAPKTPAKKDKGDAVSSGFMEDDVAYDPEDETIFQEFQSGSSSLKPPIPTQVLDSPSCPTAVSTSLPVQTPVPAAITPNCPTGSVVVSAATLSEQQRMLEELNKQIEEQKRQLKEQEEALRQQREAVGMFMAKFSVSDNFMSPPGKSLPPLQSDMMSTGSKSSESTDQVSASSETPNSANVDSQTFELNDTTGDHDVKVDENTTAEQDEAPENAEDSNKYSSAGEIGDSDVAYDPEDESLFDEIQDDVFKGGTNMGDPLSRSGHHKGTSPHSYHSRKRRSSPKRRSRRERGRHRSPSRMSQQRSPSHSRRRRERDRHRRSERDRSKHRSRDQSERQGHHHKSHSTRRHSRGQRRSTSSSRRKDSISPLSQQCGEPTHEGLLNSLDASAACSAPDFIALESETSSFPATIKKDPDGYQLECDQVEMSDQNLNLFSSQPSHNIKLEISEPQKHGDISSVLPSEVEKSIHQNTQLYDKVETTIPLREIDPPIRDSPESPDPEPQFVKHSCTGKQGSGKTEVVDPPAEQATLPEPLVIQQSSNLLLQNPCVRGENLIETGRKIAESLPTPHPAISYSISASGLGQEIVQVIASSPARESSLQNVREDMSIKDLLRDSARPHRVDNVSKIRELNANHDFTTDVTGRTQSPSQSVDGFGHSNKSGRWSSAKDIEGARPNLMGHNKQNAQIRESSNEEMAQTFDLKENMSSPEWRDPRPGFVSPDMSSRGQVRGPHRNNPNWDGSRLDITHDWRGFEQGELSKQGECRINHTDRSRPQMESQGPEIGLGSNQFGEFGPQIGGSNMHHPGHRGPGAPTFIEQRQESIGPDNDIPGHGRRGPIPAFTGHEERGQMMDIQKPGSRALRGPDFGGPELERRGLTVECPGPNTSGLHFRKSGPGRRSPALEIQVPDLRGTPGPDVRGPWPERTDQALINPEAERQGKRFLSPESRAHTGEGLEQDGSNVMVGPWHENESTEGLERRRPWPESGGSFMEDAGSDRRGPEYSNFSTTVNRSRGPIGSEFRELGPENRGTFVEGSRPDRKGHGSLDFRGAGPDNRDLSMNGPGPKQRGVSGRGFRGTPGSGLDRRGPGGSEGFGLEDRGTHKDGHSPDRGGSRHPELRGAGPENRGPFVGGHGPDRRGPGVRELRGPRPENRGSSMEIHRHDQRGPRVPEFRGPGSENKDFSLEAPRPDRRESGGRDLRGPRPENIDLSLEVPRPDRRESGGRDFRGPRPENIDLFLEAPVTDFGGPEGPVFRAPEPINRGPSLEMPRQRKRGPGYPEFSGPGPENRGRSIEVHGPDWRGPRGPDFIEPGFDGRGPVNHSMFENNSSCDPNFRGVEPEWEGPMAEGYRPDRKRPRGTDFSGPGHHSGDPYLDDFRTDKNLVESPRYRGQGGPQIFQHSDPATEFHHPPRNIRKPMVPPVEGGFRHDKIDDLGGPQPEISYGDVPGFEETDENFRSLRPMGRNMRRPEPEYTMQEFANETDASHSNWEGPGNRMQESLHEQEQDHSWQGPGGEWTGHGGRGPVHPRERPDMERSGPVMGRGDRWNDPSCRVPDHFQTDPHMVPPGANRELHRNQWEEPDPNISERFFREERFPEGRPPSNDRGQGRDIREDFQDNSDMVNTWGQPDFRGRSRAPNREGPRPQRRGPDRREFDIESPDRSGSGHNLRPGEERFEQNLGMQRRGPRMRQFGPERTEIRGPSPNSSDFRHGPCRSDADHNFLVSDTYSDMVEPGFESWEPESGRPMPHQVGRVNREPGQRGPYQTARRGEPHSALPKRSQGPGPNPSGKVFPLKTQKPRGALLPTPSEGPIRFPNRMIKK